MSNEEHVLSIELHHKTLIVIMVESNANSRVHSIVLDTEVPTAKFNIEELLDTMKNTQYKSICEKLKSIQWTKKDRSPLQPLTLHQWLSRVLMSLLTSQAMQVSKEKPPYNLSGDQFNSASRTSLSMPKGGHQIPTRANPITVFRKSTGGDTGNLRKKPHKETARTSSGSALTNINTGSRGPESVIDF